MILATHGFVDTRGWRNNDHRAHATPGGKSSNEVWNEFVHRNCSIDFVLNGHTTPATWARPGAPTRTPADNRCSSCERLRGPPQRGRRLAALLHLRPRAHDTVDAFTYSVTKQAFETDADSRFTLPYDFTPDPR